MEFLCGAVFVLAVIACAAVGARVILAAIFRSNSGDAPPPARLAYCPACTARLSPHDRYCPDCDLDLRGRLAERLNRIAAAEQEVEKRLRYHTAKLAKKIRWVLEAWKDKGEV